MTKQVQKQPERLLTEVELEFMTVLWKMGEGSVNDLLEHLSGERKLAYTSVSTILRILEQKAVLTTRKEGRGHIYIPSLSKEDYEARTLKHVIDKVFNGAPVALVKQLLDTESLSSNDLAELRRLFEQGKR
jgi:predicted transcriptional regulator